MVKTFSKLAVVGAVIALTSSVGHGQTRQPGAGDWPTYGGDAGSTRHSSLTEITPANVAKLAPAWTYHAFVPPPEPAPGAAPAPPAAGRGGGGGGGRGGGSGMRGSEATPIVVDGVMYMP
ncbi:MAG: hypothetical protein ABI665_26990, partial [Vicinamibacterales bacterium]